jgi:hypothetical protein
MSKRLELALEKLPSASWESFERFASAFFASEFPDLRTVASPAGDEGRDAELFSPLEDTTQVLQYSVAEDWRAKIRKTATRISETIPTAQLLIYATNQQIGAEADDLKKELRLNHRLHLDIRSRSYFVERSHRDAQTEAAAEELAQHVVDPWLTSEGIAKRSVIIETGEAKAAHVYLSLQLRDEAQDKGLTKISFEAFVRAVLLHTNPENLMKRNEIKRLTRQLLPNDAADRVDQLTDSALSRLTKRSIRHYPKTDEFCLAHEEVQRVTEYLAERELAEVALKTEMQSAVSHTAIPAGTSASDANAVAERLRRILEECLFDRAESFASAVRAGRMGEFATDHLDKIVIDDLRQKPAKKGTAESDPNWIGGIARELLSESGGAIQGFFRDLADAYTVFAFLRHTPDVQSAMEKIFSYGQIWLDTSVILPLLAEELLEDREGHFQQMCRVARQAGIEFFVTNGVAEELDRHIDRAVVCSKKGNSWQGAYPFLFEAFLQAGRSHVEFQSWVDVFWGPKRPLDDLLEFLEERFGIKQASLEEKAAAADVNLRRAVQEVWYGIHNRRRARPGQDADPIAVNRLSLHDSENYVGVIEQRKQDKASPFGYSAWWLTLDRSAFTIGDTLNQQFGIKAPDSPVMSIDFMSQYLSLGPIRVRVNKDSARTLPVVFEPHLVRFLTPDLLREADAIRAEMKDLPERVIRRRVRDHLDEAKRRIGPMARRGIDAFFDEIE